MTPMSGAAGSAGAGLGAASPMAHDDEVGDAEEGLDSALETRCHEALLASSLRTGAWTLLAVNASWLLALLLAALPEKDLACGLRMPLGLTTIGLSAWTAYFFVTTGLLVYSVRRPLHWLYGLVVLIYYMWFPIMSQAPFTRSCWETAVPDDCELVAQQGEVRVRHRLDCSLEANTSMFFLLALVLLSPCIIPHRRYMPLTWLWLGAIGICLWVSRRNFARPFIWEALAKLIVLCVANCVALLRKGRLTHASCTQLVNDERQREVSHRLYEVLEYMLPVHVISPMLQDPEASLADHLEVASVLFVMIEGFEDLVIGMEPQALLAFLNSHFTQIDAICYEEQVLKIETVGEEYVAAVGVGPADGQAAEEAGYSVLLGRLVQAVLRIFQHGRAEGVSFRMGIHTGPIVAGVIGRKLPRFRLFGDTVNTAARMMQRGLPGRCQFGVETKHRLPAGLPVERRGGIEMKGKGIVDVYLLGLELHSGDVRVSTARPSLRPTPRVSLVQRLSDVNIVEPLDLEEVAAGQRPHVHTHVHYTDSSSRRLEESALNADARTGADIGREPSVRQLASRRHFSNLLEALEVPSRPRPSIAAGVGTRCASCLARLHPFHGCFRDSVEERWYRWFHETAVCHTLPRRLDKYMLSLACFALVQWACMLVASISIDGTRPVLHEQWQMAVFVVATWLPFVLLGAWRLVCSTAPARIANRPRAVQALLLATQALVGLSIFWSCDSLTGADVSVLCLPSHQQACLQELEAAANRIAGDWSIGSVWSLAFGLVYFTWATAHPLLFLQACFLVGLTLVILLLANVGVVADRLYFPPPAQALWFCCLAVFSATAFSMERASRSRFKAMEALHVTRGRIQDILATLLPPGVLLELRRLPAQALPPSHHYSCAAVAQSDLVGFTHLAHSRRATEVVEIIGELFGLFDALTDRYHIYKIETIGDAYVAGQASWPLTRHNSPTEVVAFAAAMVEATRTWSRETGIPIDCRVGVHVGECIGGIVGTEMQRYHLFGALMHTLELLESTAPEGRVQVSKACHDAVTDQPGTVSETGGSSGQSLRFAERLERTLQTSKAEPVAWEAVGGRTFLLVN